MKEILEKHQDLAKIFLEYKKKIIMANKPYPLDYMMQLPKMVTSKIMELTREKIMREMEKKRLQGKGSSSMIEMNKDIDN